MSFWNFDNPWGRNLRLDRDRLSQVWGYTAAVYMLLNIPSRHASRPIGLGCALSVRQSVLSFKIFRRGRNSIAINRVVKLIVKTETLVPITKLPFSSKNLNFLINRRSTSTIYTVFISLNFTVSCKNSLHFYYKFIFAGHSYSEKWPLTKTRKHNTATKYRA